MTRRDPMPRYGASLDLFAALDQGDLAAVVALLADDVSGTVQLPEHALITFSSKAEYLAKVGPLVNGFRAAGVTSTTSIRNYDASADPTTVIASLDLLRDWTAGKATMHLRGHATLAWRIGPGQPAVITTWKITWESIRDKSGDWSKVPR